MGLPISACQTKPPKSWHSALPLLPFAPLPTATFLSLPPYITETGPPWTALLSPTVLKVNTIHSSMIRNPLDSSTTTGMTCSYLHLPWIGS